MKENRTRLTEGPVPSTLLRLTFPMLLGILSIVAFNLMDTYFVGKLGTMELAAMSFTFPVVFIIGSIAMGLGVGASAVISRAIGEGDHFRVCRYTTDSLSLAVSIVVIFVTIGMVTIEPLFRVLGAPEEILPFIVRYMRVWYPGVAFVVIPMVGNSAIRATGDTRTPAMIMVVSALINLIMDPLLIFGLGPFPRWELEGAAAATVVARFVSLLISLRILVWREKMITLKIPAFREGVESWKKILYIGLPAAGTNLIVPVSMGVITRFVSGYGPEAVAALGVSLRVESLALSMIMAMTSVLTPFIGQNWGAGKYGRLRESTGFGFKFGMVWGAALFLVAVLFGGWIGSWFSESGIVIGTVKSYLFTVSLSYGFYSIVMLSGGILNALNKPFHSAALSLFRLVILYIPLAWLGSELFGITGIFIAASFSNAAAGIAALLTVWRILRKQKGIEKPGIAL